MLHTYDLTIVYYAFRPCMSCKFRSEISS